MHVTLYSSPVTVSFMLAGVLPPKIRWHYQPPHYDGWDHAGIRLIHPWRDWNGHVRLARQCFAFMLGRPFTCKQCKRREEKKHQGRKRRPLPQAAARTMRACRRKKHEERPVLPL